MAIEVLPSKLLKKLAPKKTVERLVTRNLTLNRAAVTMLSKSGVLSKKKVEEVAIRVIRSYKETFKDEVESGASKTAALDEALNNKKLMVQRVQNTAVNEVVKEVKRTYRGEHYEWLPSDAEEPDPLHQLKYGKRFRIGKGEMPGDRYGCRCGMRILVDEDQLNLGD
jgi:hypothetical protein